MRVSKINDILIEHGELPHVLSLPVHLKFSLFEFICVTPPSCLDGWWVVANRILVSATVPLGQIGSLNLLSSPGPKPLAPNPLVPNPKPRGLGLTLNCYFSSKTNFRWTAIGRTWGSPPCSRRTSSNLLISP